MKHLARFTASLPIAYALVMFTPIVWATLAALTLTVWAFTPSKSQ